MLQTEKNTGPKYEPSSFRDPAGRLILDKNGTLQRTVNPDYVPHYRHFIESGLYQHLTESGLMIRHREKVADENLYTDAEGGRESAAFLLEPDMISLISYPYEWTFNELKAAALLTLNIAAESIKKDMILKDASAFNVQWLDKSPIFIDTLSFEKYEEGKPWMAFNQFLRHFVYPLLLMGSNKPLSLWQNIDGIQLSDVMEILPWHERINLLYYPVLGAINKGDKKRSNIPRTPHMSRSTLIGVFAYLEKVTKSIGYRGQKNWSEYNSCSYSEEAIISKVVEVNQLVEQIRILDHDVSTAIDLGANTGEYTRILRNNKIQTVAVELDAEAANRIRPPVLIADLCNPTPGLGWSNQERKPLLERLEKYNEGGIVLALALIHHLCLRNNVPLSMAIDMITGLGKHIIIEFVPPSDPKAELLTSGRSVPEYNRDIFVGEISKHHDIRYHTVIDDSKRELFYISRKEDRYA